MYWIGGILFLVFAVPNTVNFKERRHFSDSRRIEYAQEHYQADKLGDSVTIAAGPYYKRNAFATLFLGRKQRDLWATPVPVPVLDYDQVYGGLKPEDIGGGQQTISIKLEDAQGRKWSLRSVNKDQIAALPKAFRPTFMRSLIRDQLASANPYGQLVVPVLAEAAGVHHLNPQLYLVPYDKRYGDYNKRMAGRVAFLEENPGGSWKNSSRFGEPTDILNSEDMEKLQEKQKIPVDTMLYLRTRLLDLVMSDWDRHPGNMEWALMGTGKDQKFEPIPKDRDNVFYQFNEGLVGHFTLALAPKLQSFRKRYGNIRGLMIQSYEMDRDILKNVDAKTFEATAQTLQELLTSDVIREAFSKYPGRIYRMKGKNHEDIFKARLAKLPSAARKFHHLVEKANKKAAGKKS